MLKIKVADKGSGDCDFCYQRKSRNARIVHQLKMSEREFLEHLRSLYGKKGDDDGWISSRISWHRFVWNYYGEQAKTKHMPIWQAYLEGQGVKVTRAPQSDYHNENRVPF